MSYFDEAQALVEHADGQLEGICDVYQQSLRDQMVGKPLLIGIKNLMENLRSALDFSARGLFRKYGTPHAGNQNIYFPYARINQSQQEFRRAERIEKCIPGIADTSPSIVQKLESYQHFAHPENRWLPEFMELTNENKHERLTPQTRKERTGLKVESGGAGMALGPGSAVALGPGGGIKFGSLSIPGGQTFSPNDPPLTVGEGTVHVITWVSFHFDSNNREVLPFLRQCIRAVDQIATELSGA